MKSVQAIELKKLGENIRRLRKSHGLNQTNLARKALTRPTTVSSIEKGSNPNPGWNLLSRIAEALNTSIHELTKPGSDLIETKCSVAQGLKELMRRQDALLALGEPRISLGEVEWMSNIPPEKAFRLTANEFLLILRYYRLITNSDSA